MEEMVFFRTARDAHAMKRPRGKHVRREEGDSKGWWFHTELDQSLAGSKLRLPPLRDGYKGRDVVEERDFGGGGDDDDNNGGEICLVFMHVHRTCPYTKPSFISFALYSVSYGI